MALPPSGTITVSAVAAEFGGSAPHSLSEYYRGGGLVPDTTTNAGVPTSGPISLSDFYGAAAGWASTMFIGVLNNGFYNQYGFSTGTFGSMTDTTIDILGDAPLFALFFGAAPSSFTQLTLTGSYPNSGWTTLNIGAGSFSRASATSYYNSGSTTYWNWSGSTNYFGTIPGSSVNITME
jgi:hypothetical protein